MNVKNFVLGIGIVVVFALALWQGVETFYPSPEYEDYCDGARIPVPIEKGQDMSNNLTYCIEKNGTWREGYCDFYYECQKDYDGAQKIYSQKVFIISLIVSVIMIAAGYFLIKIEPVGSAFIGSGIWAIFWGSAINWRNFASYMRFVLLLIVLIFIVWLALRLNRKEKKKFWRFWK